MKGETFRCPSEDGAVATRLRSADGLIPRGFAGILGLSARLTGGGMGDMGRARGAVVLELAFSGATGELEVARCGADGEDCLVEELLWCDTISRTRTKDLSSSLSGDLDWARAKSSFGGDVGDSMLTEGVNLGDVPRCMDIGLL